MKNKCDSCKNGYNGANGDGCQPCSCHTFPEPPKMPTPPKARVIIEGKYPKSKAAEHE